MKEVQDAPTWDTFTAAYEKVRRVKCKACGSIWPSFFDLNIPKWKEEAEVKEAILPEWPLKKQG